MHVASMLQRTVTKLPIGSWMTWDDHGITNNQRSTKDDMHACLAQQKQTCKSLAHQLMSIPACIRPMQNTPDRRPKIRIVDREKSSTCGAGYGLLSMDEGTSSSMKGHAPCANSAYPAAIQGPVHFPPSETPHVQNF